MFVNKVCPVGQQGRRFDSRFERDGAQRKVQCDKTSGENLVPGRVFRKIMLQGILY